ncbi:hypothetical protein [Alloyangia pacifica]|uniref:hypothetical protein n=1 Tax=Alloyangia pacifica TaxID=311180 RepID=UPI00131F0B2A|nr:hypothetical protein [Alloyangia pacifica]
MDATFGVSFLQLLLNGEKIAAFNWGSDQSAALASRPSETEFTLEGLVLSRADVIELGGQGEGGAPLRVDYPELTLMTLPGATDIWLEEVNPDGVGNRVLIGRNDGTGRCAVADPGVRSGGRGGDARKVWIPHGRHDSARSVASIRRAGPCVVGALRSMSGGQRCCAGDTSRRPLKAALWLPGGG